MSRIGDKSEKSPNQTNHSSDNYFAIVLFDNRAYCQIPSFLRALGYALTLTNPFKGEGILLCQIPVVAGGGPGIFAGEYL